MGLIAQVFDVVNEVATMMSPLYSIVCLEQKLSNKHTSSDEKQSIRSRLMELNVMLGNRNQANFFYDEIKRNSLFVNWSFTGGEAFVLVRCAHFERIVLRDPVLARTSARRAYEIAERHKLTALASTIRMSFPGFLSKITLSATPLSKK